jgi:hypothetical protein
MVVKFFSNKKGGSSKAINYLLNEREAEGTARVLQGDPDLTREIINNIKHKQKTTVGCLSFEEKNISEKMKYQLMADFEKHLMPGMENRYNILWVEHTDKGRLELNFVIPKIDLETQKSFNPYYHKADLPRVEKWQDLQNLKYNYSSPKDPSKARTLETNSKEIYLSKDYEQLDKLLHNLTEQGQIHNREQLIELLQSNQIEVTRKGKDYLSIKLPDSKKAKKFKGSIYDEKFTSIGAVREISTRAREEVKQYNSRDTQRELERLNADLKSYTQTKEREHRKKYPIIRKEVRSRSEHINREPNRDTQEQTTKHRENDRGQARKRKQVNNNNYNNINNAYKRFSRYRSIIHKRKQAKRREPNYFILDDRNNKDIANQMTVSNLFDAVFGGKILKEVNKNDSIRKRTVKRIGTRESNQYKDYRQAASTRNELLKVLRESAKRIREESLSNSRELPNNYSNDRERLQGLFRTEQGSIRELTGRTKQLIQTNEANERNLSKFTKLREFGRGIKNAINTTREMISNRFNQIVNYYANKFNYKSEALETAVKEIQAQNKYMAIETTLKDIKGLEKTFYEEKTKDNKKMEENQKTQSNYRYR